MYSDRNNIIITKEVAKTAAAASLRAMETWQKAAGIIPICVRLAITVCGGDRYQDTGRERGRWLAHFHSLSLARGQGWPQHRAGAES